MSTTPKIMGFPLWKGRIKKRVAKKYLKAFGNKWMLKGYLAYADIKVGDFVNDCTGKNGRILEMKPLYRRIGKGYGAVLLDIDLQTTNTGCSLCSCGVEPKLPRDVIETRMLGHLKEWTLSTGGQTWYGKDTDRYKQVAEHAQKLISVIESGQHVTNEDGEFLEEFRTPPTAA